jgi:2-methylisocitrate lyase-like PEP mutase family enzyme
MATEIAAHNRKVEALRALHVPGRPLVLPNAWDAASARVVEQAGANAVATSSAAVANALGYTDGEDLPRAELLAAARRIARVVEVPLTIDVEGGYSRDPAAVADLIDEALGAGAVGINLEDGVEAPDVLVEKIRAIRARAGRSGREVFVNARTDVFLRGLAEGAAAIEETCRRGALYRDAGADGLFVPGLSDLASLATIAERCPLPLNAMVRTADFPAVQALGAARVARISLGGALFHACLSLAARIAGEVLSAGTYESLFAGEPLSYGGANGLFAPRGRSASA